MQAFKSITNYSVCCSVVYLHVGTNSSFSSNDYLTNKRLFTWSWRTLRHVLYKILHVYMYNYYNCTTLHNNVHNRECYTPLYIHMAACCAGNIHSSLQWSRTRWNGIFLPHRGQGPLVRTRDREWLDPLIIHTHTTTHTSSTSSLFTRGTVNTLLPVKNN